MWWELLIISHYKQHISFSMGSKRDCCVWKLGLLPRHAINKHIVMFVQTMLETTITNNRNLICLCAKLRLVIRRTTMPFTASQIDKVKSLGWVKKARNFLFSQIAPWRFKKPWSTALRDYKMRSLSVNKLEEKTFSVNFIMILTV